MLQQKNSAQMGAVHKWVAPGLSMLGNLSDNDPGQDYHREKRCCQNCDKPVQYSWLAAELSSCNGHDRQDQQ